MDQLVKKIEQNYDKVYPKTYMQNIIDQNTGQSLADILNQFNCYFLVYDGSITNTRKQVPNNLRKIGLWITYVKFDKTVVLEYYNGIEIDDTSWSKNENWVRASNFLVGDISISADGTWIVDGKDTEVVARGKQGITPLLQVINNKLSVSYNEGKYWRTISDYISPKFKWVDINNGINDDSVGKIQISMDLGNTWTDLSAEFTNSLKIKGYVSSISNLPSYAVQGDIYGVGPTYEEDDAEHENPRYNIYVKTSDEWVDNGKMSSIPVGLVQQLGNNEDKVISQKVVSDNIIALRDRLVVLSEKEFEQLEEKDTDKFYFIYEEET